MSIFFFGQEFSWGGVGYEDGEVCEDGDADDDGMSGWMGCVLFVVGWMFAPNAPDGIYRSAANLLPSLAPSFCKASQKRKSNMLFKESQHIIFLEIKGCATNLHIPPCLLDRSCGVRFQALSLLSTTACLAFASSPPHIHTLCCKSN